MLQPTLIITGLFRMLSYYPDRAGGVKPKPEPLEPPRPLTLPVNLKLLETCVLPLAVKITRWGGTCFCGSFCGSLRACNESAEGLMDREFT
jgi:hypothetical protein